jgi:hypothetical protein
MLVLRTGDDYTLADTPPVIIGKWLGDTPSDAAIRR